MAIVKRNNEVIWNLNNEKMPGYIFKEGLYSNTEKKNNFMVAENINKKEMIGLGMKI